VEYIKKTEFLKSRFDLGGIEDFIKKAESTREMDFYNVETVHRYFDRKRTEEAVSERIRVLFALLRKIKSDKKCKHRLFPKKEGPSCEEFLFKELQGTLQYLGAASQKGAELSPSDIDCLQKVIEASQFHFQDKAHREAIDKELGRLLEKQQQLESQRSIPTQVAVDGSLKDPQFGSGKASKQKQGQGQQQDAPPQKVEGYLDKAYQLYSSGGSQRRYFQIDEEFKKTINEYYCQKQNKADVAKSVFKYFDKGLGSYLSWEDAKNYKKLLAAVQKCKLLAQVEINTLFDKANRFLDKKSGQKEKKRIEDDIKQQYIERGKARTPGKENEDDWEDQSDSEGE